MIEYGVNYQSEIKISWLPLLEVVLALGTCSTTYSLYLHLGYFKTDEWPTISETAREYPMSKIFAIGISVFAFIFIFLAFLMHDLLELYGCEKSKYFKFIPLLCSVFLTSMSCCTLNDHPFVHGTLSITAFVLCMIFAGFIHFYQLKAQILKWKMLKTIILTMICLTTVLLGTLTMIDETKVINCAKAVIEYVLFACLLFYFGSWTKDVDLFKLSFCILIPQTDIGLQNDVNDVI